MSTPTDVTIRVAFMFSPMAHDRQRPRELRRRPRRWRLELGGEREREVARLRIAGGLLREQRARLDLAATASRIRIPSHVLRPRVEIPADGRDAPVAEDVLERAQIV